MADPWCFAPAGNFAGTRESARPQTRSMTPDNRKSKRLVALFLFGFALLNYPILSLLNLDITVFAIPLVYIYILGIWSLLIFLSALVMSRSKKRLYNSEKSGN
jgi:hypothetical protein